MTALRYGTAAVILVGFLTLGVWPFLEPSGRRGVLLAAAVALPVQIASFAVLRRVRDTPTHFLAVWVGGTVVRMTALGAVAFVVIRTGTAGLAATLVALASFFVGLLFLEPIYFREEVPQRAAIGSSR